MHAFLIISGSGPILALSTYRSLDDERLRDKLRYKGITRFMAYEIDLEATRKRYRHAFERVAEDLDGVEDLRVLDYNGHQIMANFRLEELAAPIHVGGDGVDP